MTLFGPDVSSFQAGLRVHSLKQQGFTFLSARASIGHHIDTEFPRFRAEAKAENMLFAAYHFLKSSSNTPIAEQVATCRRAVSNEDDVMLDWERDINSVPNANDASMFIAQARAAGIRVRDDYLPHWYWKEIGQPDSSLPLVASRYVKGTGYASVIYPGDRFWPADYANNHVILWQFSDQVKIDSFGSLVDCNAFKGTLDQLKALSVFRDWSKPVTQPAKKPAWSIFKTVSPYWQAIITGNDPMTAAQRLGDIEQQVSKINTQVAEILTILNKK